MLVVAVLVRVFVVVLAALLLSQYLAITFSFHFTWPLA